MKSTVIVLLVATCTTYSAATLGASSQRGELREYVRQYGSSSRFLQCCGPTIGVKEIVQFTQLTVEGSVVRANAELREDGRDEYVYTDYVIHVARTFRAPAFTGGRAGAGETVPWPFITDPAPKRTRVLGVRIRVPFQGTVRVDGGTITDRRNFPTLQVGQHLILSAYFCRDVGAWVPLGVFEVRDGRVIRLEAQSLERDYATVDELAAALANPPLTVR
jgi:hypothetical protein